MRQDDLRGLQHEAGEAEKIRACPDSLMEAYCRMVRTHITHWVANSHEVYNQKFEPCPPARLNDVRPGSASK